MEQHKEPTLEEYGLDANSYENYRNQKKILENDLRKITYENENKIKDSESKIDSILVGVYYLVSFLLSLFFFIKEESFAASLFSSIFLAIPLCYILIVFFEIIFSFLNINISKSILKSKNLKDNIDKYTIKSKEIDAEIRILKNKIYPFEQACSNYYKNYLEQFYVNNLFKKHSGTEKFNQSVAEFSSMLNEVDEISKKMQTSLISTNSYKSYLEGRKINSEYKISKKFNTFNNIDTKLSSAYEIEGPTQEKKSKY